MTMPKNSPQPAPAVRSPGCPVLIPIGHDGSHGWCPAHEHRVYLEAAGRCLCDFCTPGPDNTRVMSKDVIFVGNDIIDIKSARAAKLAAATEQAATI